jgi:methyl-accepting chemotaxis protein
MSAAIRLVESTGREQLTEDDLVAAIDVCIRASHGDLEARLDYPEDSPVLARLHGSINALLDATDAFVRESAASLDHVSRDSFDRRVLERGLQGSFRRGAVIINAATKTMGQRSKDLAALGERQVALAEQLDQTIGGLALHVASAAHELEASVGSLLECATRTADGAEDGGRATERARAGVDAVARSTEQLRTEIASISERAARSTQIAGHAVDGARKTEKTAEGVAEASRRIGDVVKLISGVAGQTKLLALNAAIEAARAGEAGKGFGVVASEVKSLAGEAAMATEEIASQIGAIQTATDGAVDATRAVVTTIQELFTVADAIDRAVETQTSVSADIAGAVADAQEGTSVLTGAVAIIADAANATRMAVNDVRGAAASLAELASKLTGEVSALVAEIRAASKRRT